jgi:hypothetical protein
MEDRIDPRWRKSTFSGNGGSDCVEVGNATGAVLVRDTKRRDGGSLRFAPDAWSRFTAELKKTRLALGSVQAPNRGTLGLGVPLCRVRLPAGSSDSVLPSSSTNRQNGSHRRHDDGGRCATSQVDNPFDRESAGGASAVCRRAVRCYSGRKPEQSAVTG